MKKIFSKHNIRSIFVVTFGFVFALFVAVFIDRALEFFHLLPKDNLNTSDLVVVLVVLYRSLVLVLAATLVAMLSPGNSWKLVTILGVLCFLFSFAGTVTTFNQHFAPHWYMILRLAFIFPSVYLGYAIFHKLKV